MAKEKKKIFRKITQNNFNLRDKPSDNALTIIMIAMGVFLSSYIVIIGFGYESLNIGIILLIFGITIFLIAFIYDYFNCREIRYIEE